MLSISSIKHNHIYLFGLMVMAVGLPSSNLLMSISQIIIGVNWFIEGDYKTKFKRFIRNKPALIFASIFGLHLVGLLYTSNFEYALWDLRNKVPMLLLPFFIVSSAPLSSHRIDQVFKVFVTAVVVFSIICAGELTPINNWFRGVLNMPEREIMDARSISHFISHIRFALMICLSISWLLYRATTSKISKSYRLLNIILSIWLTAFLFLLESMTGLVVLFIIGFVSILYLGIRQNSKLVKLGSLALLILIPAMSIRSIGNMVADFYHINEEDVADLPRMTVGGELYFHDLSNTQIENGNYVWRYVCHIEIEPAWEQRSSIAFKGKDRVGQFLEYTLFRYLTSKGLRKDAEGLASLTDEEITLIENGVANEKYTDVTSIRARIYGIIWEVADYNQQGEPGGHSLSQRWEFWKTGVNVLKNNPLTGVGTGDVYDAMLAQYELDASILGVNYRKHPHNQYLSMAIGFGLIGLIIFLFGLLYPVRLNWSSLDYVALVFVGVTLLSMTTEDTLESQAGVSFVTFFYSLLIFQKSDPEGDLDVNEMS